MALKDQADLAADVTFQARVREGILAAAIAISNEAVTVQWHKSRATLAKAVMNNPGSYAPLFANAVATDAAVTTDAGTPATQANVTDAHINAAISGMWNSFFSIFD
jgi:hypothetical protein